MPEPRPITPLLTWCLTALVAGLFLVFALLMFVGSDASRSTAQLWLTTWAALVLALTGGARWGFEVASRGNVFLMAVGLIPALLAFAALNVPIAYQGGRVPLIILGVGFVGGAVWDVVAPITPRWYRPMSLVIASAALASLGAVWLRVGQLGL